MARGDSAVRLLKVLMYLERSPSGLTIKDIHDRLKQDGIDCSERTVYRDLQVISSAHFPIVSETELTGSENTNRWKFSRTTALSEKVHFEYNEIFALFLARESLKSMKGSPLIDDILKMTEKLERALGPSVEKELKNLKSYVSYKANATWHSGVSQEILDTVYSACWEKSVLSIDYKSKSGEHKDQIKQRKLGPETLYFANGGAYLIAKDLDENKVKTYSLSRIISASIMDEEYASSDFQIEKYIQDQFGIYSDGETHEIKIEIFDPIASYVSERRWHDSQKIVRHGNKIEMSLKVKINDELARWILGFGSAAKVLNCIQLEDLIKQQALDILNRYNVKKSA